MIKYQPSKLHWNYFLAIERDFEIVSRFIEPCEDNNQTYSIELARLLMTATQEVDVVLKLLCRALVPRSRPENISQYYPIISSQAEEMLAESVYVNRFGLVLNPWSRWTEDNAPGWWQANNQIKHNRSEKFDSANMLNVTNAIAALLTAVAYYYNRTDDGKSKICMRDWLDVTSDLLPPSNLFTLNPDYYRKVKHY